MDKNKNKFDIKPADEIMGGLLKAYVKIKRVFYPKLDVKSIIPGGYGILLAQIQEVISGSVPGNCVDSFFNAVACEICIKGPIPTPDFGTVYYFEGILMEDVKYGLQYEIKQLHKVFALQSLEQKEIFLKAILGAHKTELLMSNFPDPCQPLETEDEEALINIKGISEITARAMISKYQDNLAKGGDVVQFQQYGLSANTISKLQDIFRSTDTVLYIIENNPYVLMEIEGIGWARADAIALNGNYSPSGPNRICAYIKYFLQEQASLNGHSWVNLDFLINNIVAISPTLSEESLREMLREWTNLNEEDDKQPWLYYEPGSRRIGLMYYRKLEEQIAEELLRLQHSEVSCYNDEEIEEAIAQSENKTGFAYTEEQRKAIGMCLEQPVTIISGAAGCVDCDTEYFNGIKWKRIADYQEGEKVLQYNKDGGAELVVPEDYVKYPEENLWLTQTKCGVDMCLSEEHNVYYLTPNNNLYHKSFKEIREEHENAPYGFSGKFITSFNYNGEGISLTDDEIKREKIFTPYWYNCSHRQLQLICDNILHRDGCGKRGRRSFSTTVKESADFIQFAFSACGYKATVKAHDLVGYTVSISNKNLASIGGFCPDNKNKTKITPYKTLDGFKYCFTVPTHMWLMRRGGKILVTGNTGKTSIMDPVCGLLRKYKRPFAQCALSGKASSNLSEITGQKGHTIHRLLGVDMQTKTFNHDETCPLVLDVLILDELSLVGGEIFLDLLKAIPNGCRLIMLGDPNQLEAIGLANLLKDCVGSHVIPAMQLSKIHRQAAKSGIIMESLRASAGEQIIGQVPEVTIKGELQDLKLVTYTDSSLSQDKVIEEFKELYFNKKISIKDIAIVVPMRTRGTISCFPLNNIIQSLVNNNVGEEDTVNFKNLDGEYQLRKGDKIIITRNNYKTLNLEGGICAIFNGNTGFIKEINKHKKIIIVDLVQQGEVAIPYIYWRNIELGYAITAHKIQGSASPNVVVALDMTAYTLLSKEWIYTALTRAKKYCVLVTQIAATRKAVEISKVTIKHTWLQELLINLNERFRDGDNVRHLPNLTRFIHKPKELLEAEQKLGRQIEIQD